MQFASPSSTDAPEVPEYLKLYSKHQTPSEDNIALFEAAASGDDRKTVTLLKDGASPFFYHRPEDRKNALHAACENGHSKVVKILLTTEVPVDMIAITSKATALIFASQTDDPEITAMLVAAGANKDAVNSYGNSALHIACSLGNTKVGIELVKVGASVTLQNHKGSTALHLLGYSDSTDPSITSLAQEMIQAGSDVNALDHEGRSPYLVCCTSGRVDVMKALIRAGAKTDIKDKAGMTAEKVATFYNMPAVVKFLKDK